MASCLAGDEPGRVALAHPAILEIIRTPVRLFPHITAGIRCIHQALASRNTKRQRR